MPEQKRILIAHNFTFDSYLAISIYLAKYLVSKGYKVLFLSRAPTFKEPIYHEGVEILGWPNKTERGWKSFKFFVSVHKRFKPDMVIAHFGAVNITMFVSWIFRTPFRIAYYHTLSSMTKLDSNVILYYAMKRRSLIYSIVTDIIFPSKFAKKDFNFFHPLRRPRFNVIHYGLPDRNNNFLEEEISLSKTKQFHFLGRIDKSKGILELVEAFKIIYKKYPNINLQISGSGKLVDDLKQKIENIDYIKYLGPIPYKQVDPFLQTSYFNIFPSKSDNLPTVVLESLMNGTPMITSNRGGIPEMVTDGYDGFIFESYNTDSINEAIEKSLNLSEAEYRQMKLNARKKYLDKFEMSIYTKNMHEFIEQSFLKLNN